MKKISCSYFTFALSVVEIAFVYLSLIIICMEADPIDQKTDKARNLITNNFKRTPGPPPQHLYNLSSKIHDNDLSIVFEMVKYK